MKIMVFCDGESVTANSLLACLATEDLALVSSGPEISGQAARTGWIWRVTFEAHDVSRVIWATNRFMQSVRQSHKAASANLCIERCFVGEGSDAINQLSRRIDRLEAGIRDAIVGLKKTRRLLGGRVFAKIRQDLEGLGVD